MIDPVKAEEHMQAGKEYFQKFDFPSAVKEFSEGIKRNPTSTAIYSNRSATYIKLMEFPHALKDAEKCLQLDPNFVKGYLRKGICHHFLKEYHKALDTFDKGLKLDADNKEIKEAKLKTMQAIQMGSYGGGSKNDDDEERVRHA
jgi:stress-induced-phosphoprotein 1